MSFHSHFRQTNLITEGAAFNPAWNPTHTALRIDTPNVDPSFRFLPKPSAPHNLDRTFRYSHRHTPFSAKKEPL
jgi:hypothetical protein